MVDHDSFFGPQLKSCNQLAFMITTKLALPSDYETLKSGHSCRLVRSFRDNLLLSRFVFLNLLIRAYNLNFKQLKI